MVAKSNIYQYIVVYEEKMSKVNRKEIVNENESIDRKRKSRLPIE
jgi:hypothetical protein